MQVNLEKIAQELNLNILQVENCLKLIEEGNTVAFIARYRKEQTNNLNEDQIRIIYESYQYQEKLVKRKDEIKKLIQQRATLTAELISQIDAATKLVELEDIFSPYKEKRNTRASKAIAAGLDKLSQQILENQKINDLTSFYHSDYPTDDEVLQGASDIIAEMVADDTYNRNLIRSNFEKHALIKVKLKKNAQDEKLNYKLYYNYINKINQLKNYQILAINRAEKEGILSVNFDFKIEFLVKRILSRMIKTKHLHFQLIKLAIEDGLNRLLIPQIENEVWKNYLEQAFEASIDLFSTNLQQLLLKSPIKNKVIMALDPGIRTGCKLAIIDANNQVLYLDVLHLVNNKNLKQTLTKIIGLLDKYQVDIIAIGNGTASRETEQIIANLIKNNELNQKYLIVSEVGASIYSVSKLAQEEFPYLDATLRSAISIGRRVIDPLSELIKIDAKSIGVGQYQHDVPQKRLKERLDFVVETVVNRVGVNVNNASLVLLQHISGLNKKIAQAIIDYRESNGKITSRDEILKIKGIGTKTYQQAIGFLRIIDGKNILDAYSIHPENYSLVYKILNDLNLNLPLKEKLLVDINLLAEKYQKSEILIEDLINSLNNATRDYREDFDKPLLRSDILEFKDVKIGDVLQGTVTNITDFGVFVDIGLKNDALIHISNLKNNHMHPSEIVSLNSIVKVEISGIEEDRQKLQLRLL